MTTAYWCVLIMILFPYVFTVLAKTGRGFDNHDPRAYLANLNGWRKRANYVQANSFEALPAFGLAVIIAHLAHASQETLNILAIIFVAARVIYAICYLTDKATLRSLFWFIGLGCVIGMFWISRSSLY